MAKTSFEFSSSTFTTKRKQQKHPAQTFKSYKRPAHKTLKKALVINGYYRPLLYFWPVKMTTLNDKHLVEISDGPSELQMTSPPQMPTEDIQLGVQMTTYQHTNNGCLKIKTTSTTFRDWLCLHLYSSNLLALMDVIFILKRSLMA